MEVKKNTNELTLGQKIGRPLMYIGAGFILCKIMDAYLEKQKVKRLAP